MCSRRQKRADVEKNDAVSAQRERRLMQLQQRCTIPNLPQQVVVLHGEPVKIQAQNNLQIRTHPRTRAVSLNVQ